MITLFLLAIYIGAFVLFLKLMWWVTKVSLKVLFGALEVALVLSAFAVFF
ncbi:MAG: hypothetical protein K6B52_09505 [Clostridiales bacterium]|nr:hypothetical protein [Clostridiales bacterium]